MEGKLQETPTGFEVVTEYLMSNEPMKIVNHYRVTVANGRIDLDKPWLSWASGSWRGLGYQVGTDKLPYQTEQIPLSPPKTRLQTRWHNERWEKYSKVQGWIIA